MTHPCPYIGRLDDDHVARCGMAIPRDECRFDRPLSGVDCPYYHGPARSFDEVVYEHLLADQP